MVTRPVQEGLARQHAHVLVIQVLAQGRKLSLPLVPSLTQRVGRIDYSPIPVPETREAPHRVPHRFSHHPKRQQIAVRMPDPVRSGGQFFDTLLGLTDGWHSQNQAQETCINDPSQLVPLVKYIERPVRRLDIFTALCCGSGSEAQDLFIATAAATRVYLTSTMRFVWKVSAVFNRYR